MTKPKEYMVTFDSRTLVEVAQLATLLRSRTPLTEEERRRLSEPYHRRVIETMMSTGSTWGEATGGRGTAINTRNEDEFRIHLRSIDNNLNEQLRIVREGVEDYFMKGEIPAPYYAWRIGVILRKIKEFQLEADFLEAFAFHFHDGCGSRYEKIVDRAKKARRLASKATKKL